jgi:preprotein translocase subunit SecG
MEHVLLVVQMIVALFLIGCVLLQRSDSDGLGGLGAGGGSGLFSSRGQANLMTRTTAILAAVFMLNSLVLGIITARGGSDSLVNELVAEQPTVIEAPKDGVNMTPQTAPTDAPKPTEMPKDSNGVPVAPPPSSSDLPEAKMPTKQGMSSVEAPKEAPASVVTPATQAPKAE